VESNIRMDLGKIRVGSWGVDATGSGQGTLAGPCEHCNVVNLLIICVIISFSRGLCPSEVAI
jgi:hypothetical protein